MSGNFAIDIRCRMPDGSQMVSNRWIWSKQTMTIYSSLFNRDIDVGIPTEEEEEGLARGVADTIRMMCQEARKQYEHQKEDQTYLRARGAPKGTEEVS